jgi:branched-chain amino acid transport system ATP-binding protein
MPSRQTTELSSPLLALDRVSVAFGSVAALAEVSFSVARGEVVGIIGPNGAGKTSLFNCISGFAKQDAGSIRYDGAVIDHLPPHRRARLGIGRSFQNMALFEQLSAFDNIRIGAENGRPGPRRSYNTARQLIDEFGLSGLELQPVARLSTGLRKRVEIARALASGPRLLLLDEPTAGINTSDGDQIMSAIAGVRDAEGMAVLLVEHDVSVVMKRCDRLVVLDFGRVIADGLPADIAASRTVQNAYLGGSV